MSRSAAGRTLRAPATKESCVATLSLLPAIMQMYWVTARASTPRHLRVCIAHAILDSGDISNAQIYNADGR
jgi:hypothetical protein